MENDRREFLAGFGMLANALDKDKGEDGDTNASFPKSDAEDLARGARHIPGEVTLARRRGKKVRFIQKCGQCCWYWEFPDGSRYYHWERGTYERIARANGQKFKGEFQGVAGICPHCKNPHTQGGMIKSSELSGGKK